MIPRIAIALGGAQTSTFRQALQDGFKTEGLGLDKVIGYVKGAYQPNDNRLARFLRLYEIAYDGMNDTAIWEEVISEIIQELRSPGRLLSPLPKGFQFNSETQAIWRLVERKISPTPGVIRPRDDFGGAGFPAGSVHAGRQNAQMLRQERCTASQTVGSPLAVLVTRWGR